MTEQGSQKENSNSLEDLKGKVANLSVEKRWAMSCYIPVVNLFTCVLTSVKMVNSKFCRFHARQGLIVFALWAVTILIGVIFPSLGLMLQGIFLLLCIAGIVVAYGGKEGSIPIIGQFAQKIPEYLIFKTLTGKIPEQDEVVEPQSPEKKITEEKAVEPNLKNKS